jgi:hypothetical protein
MGVPTLTALSLLLAASCQSGDGSDGPAKPGPEEGSTPEYIPSGGTGECNVDALLQPFSYGAKVKTLLTGLPLTDAELTQLQADPDALAGLIDDWMTLDESQASFVRFFMSAFQQTTLDNESFFYPLGFNNTAVGRFENPRTDRLDVLLNQNFAESFARTAWEIASTGAPWTEVITTKRFMMTTAQMAYSAYTDDVVVDDDEGKTTRTTNGHFPTLRFTLNQAAAPPPSEALDASHPNFGMFWHSDLVDLPVACNVTAINVVDTTQLVDGEWRLANNNPSFNILSWMLGRQQTLRRHNDNNLCNTGAANVEPLFDRADFSDWRMVDVVKPPDGGDGTIFYDLASLRNATELRLHADRVGFMSTPGFQGTWQTNEDNSARVTINQILIVAVGASFEGEAVSDFSPTEIDEEHAEVGSECYGCHQTLDPMRDYVRGSWTNFYGQQLDPERQNMASDFVFKEVQESGAGIADLAETLAAHPLFGEAWAQKLCYFANSEACPEGAELDRIVAAFVESDHDFTVLVRELFSSPLITGQACVEGVDAGTTATIARRSLFCSQLSNRLGLPDVCGQWTLPEVQSDLQEDVHAAVSSVPDEGFSRAVVEPVVIAETGMFSRANREAACVLAAEGSFDDLFAMATVDEVITVLVEALMGLPPSDPRHDESVLILQDHVTDAVLAEKTEPEALQSAFAVACMSPGSAGVGF